MLIAQTAFWIKTMRRSGLYAALAMCVYGLPATAEERFERWSLEQPGGFIFALSFKRSSYLVQVPSNVWQYSPAWQKCQWRDLLAWHSQVFALTRPSGQC